MPNKDSTCVIRSVETPTLFRVGTETFAYPGALPRALPPAIDLVPFRDTIQAPNQTASTPNNLALTYIQATFYSAH